MPPLNNELNDRNSLRNKVLGLGEKSLKKNYYSELQDRAEEMERFRTLLDQVDDGIIICNIPKGIIVDANKSAQENILNKQNLCDELNINTFLGNSFLNQLNEFFIESCSKNNNNNLHLHNLELSLNKRDFEISVSFYNYNNMWFVTLFFHDFSERKLIETTLNENKEYLQTILDLVSEAIIIQDGDDYHILDFNLGVQEIFGYSNEECHNLEFKELSLDQNPYSLKEAFALFKKAKSEGPQCFEWKAKHKNGNTFWVEITIRYAAIGNRKNFITVIRNINERKENEESRLKIEQQLLHSQKLESLGVLAGGIAHDFNNILTAVLGHTELSLLKISKPQEAKAHLLEIKNATKRASELSQQMLAYSGKGQFILEPIDLNIMIKEMLELLKVSISKKISLDLQLRSNIPVFEGGISQIRQILMNLITNASEAIGDNEGQVRIKTGSTFIDANDKNMMFMEQEVYKGEYVFFEVSDSGCGMSKETLEKIFDPFFTTKFTGRGLGMSAVLGIVRGHKGLIHIYSELGEGTIFKLYFPANIEEKTHNLKKEEEKNLAPDNFKGKILVVDDEPWILNIAKDYLSFLGLETELAKDGLDAVNKVKADPNKYDLIILDLTMPNLGGDEAFNLMKEINHDIKIILMSGFSEYELKSKFAHKGFLGFLQKPFSYSDFREKIIKVLN